MARAAEPNRRRYRYAWSLLLALIAAQTVASGASSVAGIRVPKNYEVTRVHGVAQGIYHIELRRRSPEQVVNVARIERRSPHRLKVLLSNGMVAGPEPRTERTSKMCRKANCLIAVNGDYFSGGIPVGGLIIAGEPIRSPAAGRKQFSLTADESPSIQTLALGTSLITTHRRVRTGGLKLLEPPPTYEQRTTAISGVNVPRPRGGIVLYTPRWGATTGVETGYELVARVTSRPRRPSVGADTKLEIVGGHTRGGKIPKDGVVLSGRDDAAAALADIWRDVSSGDAHRAAALRVTASPNVSESVAGKEILVHEGKVVAPSRSSRAPRTMIGWNAAGDILLVTVDGRQRGRANGLTLMEAADLIRRMGAVEALNLDGGGSTTFVKKGKVVNRPSNSGGSERNVAVAVAVVPA